MKISKTHHKTRTGVVKRNPKKKFYTKKDFYVEKDGDSRIAYVFKSKDDVISANVFSIPGEYVEVRGLVWDTRSGDIKDNFGIRYLFKAKDKPESSDFFLTGIVRRANEVTK